ncbi:hypothetical protein AVEN_60854-1 [Araneus ventricosus]|uniref:Uncharacterized protein n=1 Tax=Araneus ventricosus TaxID=182803 RepID=A0A4Y2HRJ8_ARAVE|nr:hypothetical protein AVEN_60854-1 [Araneus ventricosus]
MKNIPPIISAISHFKKHQCPPVALKKSDTLHAKTKRKLLNQGNVLGKLLSLINRHTIESHPLLSSSLPASNHRLTKKLRLTLHMMHHGCVCLGMVT